MIIYQKYSFNSQRQAEELINQLGYEMEDGMKYPTHPHTISNLGFLIKTPATYDGDNNQLTPSIYHSKWSVDVLWKRLPLDEEDNVIFPEGWQDYLLTGLESYKHSFYGWEYEY